MRKSNSEIDMSVAGKPIFKVRSGGGWKEETGYLWSREVGKEKGK